MSDLIELNENMTTEDIVAYADAVVKEVAEERQGDRKPDSEIVSDASATREKTAENNSGSKAVLEKEQDEDSGESPKSPKWVDDKVKAEVAAYGIDESDLSDFASREELDRALRLLDKKAFEAGREALAEDNTGKTRNEKGQFSKKQETDDESQSRSEWDGDRYEVSLSKEIYDDDIVDEFTRLRDHYENRLKRLESRFADVSAREEEQRFDNYVDSLQYAELFGKTGSESSEELERRRELHVAVKAQLLGLERLGRPAELTDQLVSKVANMVFADEITKKRLKQHTQKISRQNQLRQGGSPTKPIPPRENAREEFARLFDEMRRG